MPFVFLTGILIVIACYFLAMAGEDHKRKQLQKAAFEQIKKLYYKSLLTEPSFAKVATYGQEYYKLAYPKKSAKEIFAIIQNDMLKNVRFNEFTAILTVFYTAAYNPYKDALNDSRSLKMIEILKSWGILVDNTKPDFNVAKRTVAILKGQIDISYVFSKIEAGKHDAIALLTSDIIFASNDLEDYQFNILKGLAGLNDNIKKTIAQSTEYYQKRLSAINIPWTYTNGEHVAVS